MVRAGIDWLRSRGARTIGLETMPRTIDNIGFYSPLGFVPRHLTVTLVRDAVRAVARDATRLSTRRHRRRHRGVRRAHDAAGAGRGLHPRDALTHELGLGDTTLVRRGGRLVGFALWHSTPLAAGPPEDELRVLKLVARDAVAFERLLDGLQADAIASRLRRVAVRCQTAFAAAYTHLAGRGFRVHWTDLRMTLPEARSRGSTAMVMSNWEI